MSGARPPRRGEELDLDRIGPWLEANVDGICGVPTVTQFSGGASNWTYALSYPDRELVLRRPPRGTKAKSAHDMSREFEVQRALRPVYPWVPEVLALCADPSVTDAEFYVMERVPGRILRARVSENERPTPAQCAALCSDLIDKLVALHAVDVEAAGLDKLGRGPGYCRRQVEGWSERYERALTWNVPRATYVRDYLAANVPDDVGACVIHNDFRLDNAVLDPDDVTRVVALLDWEMATVGDPLMDLGGGLAYWVQPDDDIVMRALRRQPTHLPGMLRRDQVVATYLERSGRSVADFTFYEVFGLFRLAVIAQQIYYRYHHRQTRNPAFRWFWVVVNALILRGYSRIRRARGRLLDAPRPLP
ncbi:MAG: phosphotransferase family protein [Myxococcales bacterium]|nr:phosphotransferase family protein [Myxococcales bacterium]MCB9519710.1 phosphotransferase family protein [Myxococcales bacterium]MCB9530401.1 phosphotransferase family protein [Myxococcales bacterium]MCB9533648.1 phosphotransferase family protein [Myxococcales bacterium]